MGTIFGLITSLMASWAFSRVISLLLATMKPIMTMLEQTAVPKFSSASCVAGNMYTVPALQVAASSLVMKVLSRKSRVFGFTSPLNLSKLCLLKETKASSTSAFT